MDGWRLVRWWLEKIDKYSNFSFDFLKNLQRTLEALSAERSLEVGAKQEKIRSLEKRLQFLQALTNIPIIFRN